MEGIILALSWILAQELHPQSLDGALDDLVAQISGNITGEARKVAVVDFTDLDGRITEFGQYIAEELITRLFLVGKFEVVERRFLNRVLEEQKLSSTALVDPRSAQRIGKLLGVEAIVSGTITDLGRSLRVNARMISTETGRIFGVAAVGIGKDEVVRRLMARKKAWRPVIREEEVGKVREDELLPFERTFEVDDPPFHWRITLVSYRLVPKNGKISIIFRFLVENLLDEKAELLIQNRVSYKYETCLLDNLGNRYSNPKISPEGRILVAPKRPAELYVSFSNVDRSAEAVFVYLAYVKHQTWMRAGSIGVLEDETGGQLYFGPIQLKEGEHARAEARRLGEKARR